MSFSGSSTGKEMPFEIHLVRYSPTGVVRRGCRTRKSGGPEPIYKTFKQSMLLFVISNDSTNFELSDSPVRRFKRPKEMT